MAKPKSLEALIVSLNDRTEDQYKDLDRRLDNIEKVMIAQEINLKTHMQRSKHLETIVENLQEKELKPLARHVAHVEGAFKLIGGLALLLTIITGLAKLFSII
jgi:uncharacterized membrane protein